LDKVFLPPSRHCRHPSIRTLGERFCSLGASWVFSFQPVLPPDYRPLSLSWWKWARRLTQSPQLGVLAFDFPFPEMFLFLRCDRQPTWLVVMERFVRFSAHPQMMQQDGQFSCRRNHGSFLPSLSTALGQLQAPAPHCRSPFYLCFEHVDNLGAYSIPSGDRPSHPICFRQLRSWKLLKIDLPCPEGREFASLRARHSCKSFSGSLATISPY
jgi:hypothetical protein